MEVVPVQGALLERVLDATCLEAADGLDRRGYGRLDRALMKTAWGSRARRRFALMDGPRLVASAVQHDLRGMVDARPAHICGIGSVFAAPGTRDGGGARALIKALVDRAHTDGADFALLFPQPEVDDEALEGFTAISPDEVRLTVTESTRYGAPMTMVRGGEDRDLAAIVAMGRVRAEPWRFHLDRDIDFVQHAIVRRRLVAGLGGLDRRQLQFFIAEEGTTAAAYIVLDVQAGIWTLEECGDRDRSGARVGALLQALIAREPAERRPAIRAWLPPGFLPPQVAIASSAPSPELLMLRALRPAGVAVPPPGDVLYWHNDLL